MHKRVLIADDDTDVLESLGAYLRLLGYEVYLARNGEQALQIGTRAHPDAVICDWIMGRPPDGATVVYELKSSNPALVPIFITGSTVERLQAVTQFVNDARYFQKPVYPDQLVKALVDAGCEP